MQSHVSSMGQEDLEKLHPAIYRWQPERARAPAVFPLGLGQEGVHEVCEASFGDMPALTGFALSAAKPRRGAIAWISQRCTWLDHGAYLPAGIRQICRDPADIISIEVSKLADALWTIEEAVRSAAVGCVMAEIDVWTLLPRAALRWLLAVMVCR